MWEPFRNALLTELLGATSKLEGKAVSRITHKVLSKVASVVEVVEGMSIRMHWFDNVIKKILKA